jgi:chaperonin cofactor prefoldin
MSNSAQTKLQTATADYQKIQLDLSNVVEARQRLDAQLNENELVKKASTRSPFALEDGPDMHSARTRS